MTTLNSLATRANRQYAPWGLAAPINLSTRNYINDIVSQGIASARNTTPTPDSGLSTGAQWLGAGAGVLQGLGGLASAYTAYKGLQLAKDQFRYQKGLANRNLANQAKIINNSYNNAAQVAAGMIGGGSYNPDTDSQGNYGMTDQAIVDRYAQKAREKHVDGSPV